MEKYISLYIHIPFCRAKCAYCDFKSFPGLESKAEEYKNAIIKEINAFNCDSTVKSIFIGGGTPSAVDSSVICGIMGAIGKKFYIYSDAEITIEINPGTVDEQKLRAYRSAGINRISIGMQAWQDRLLKSLGRIHNNEEFLRCYDMVRKTTFDNVNIDMMFALPNQSFEDWCETLENAVALKPEHFSAYSLIIEEGTPFYNMYMAGSLKPVDEELDRKMYYYVCDYLAEKGYNQYEISNFAAKGRECIHNTVYWRRSDYKGFGLAAASLINNVRYKNTENLNEYLSGNYIDHSCTEALDKQDCMAEFMFLGMRCTKGISEGDFLKNFGCPIDSIYGSQLKKFEKQGLIERKDGSICLTRRGIDISNMVFCEFL